MSRPAHQIPTPTPAARSDIALRAAIENLKDGDTPAAITNIAHAWLIAVTHGEQWDDISARSLYRELNMLGGVR